MMRNIYPQQHLPSGPYDVRDGGVLVRVLVSASHRFPIFLTKGSTNKQNARLTALYQVLRSSKNLAYTEDRMARNASCLGPSAKVTGRRKA